MSNQDHADVLGVFTVCKVGVGVQQTAAIFSAAPPWNKFIYCVCVSEVQCLLRAICALSDSLQCFSGVVPPQKFS